MGLDLCLVAWLFHVVKPTSGGFGLTWTLESRDASLRFAKFVLAVSFS